MLNVQDFETTSGTGNFVGVVAPLSFQYGAHIKRLLLMFDVLALDMGESSMSLVERRILSNAQKDIEWLSRSHLLTTLDGLAATAAPVRRAEVSVFGDDLLAAGIGREAQLMRRAGGLVRIAVGGLRHTASDLRSRFGVDAVAVPTGMEVQNADAVATREAVVRITLGEFPLPSDATPWDAVQSFRHDENARAQFARLKQWMNKTGKAGLQEYEVTDELRELVYEYEEAMKLHRMRASRGVLECSLQPRRKLRKIY